MKRSRRQSNEARWSTPGQRIESQSVRSADILRYENEGARRASVQRRVLRLGCDLATNTECFRVEARAAGYALLPRRILRSRPWSRLISSSFHPIFTVQRLVRPAKNWCLRLCDAATAITEPPRSRWIDALRKLQPQGPLWIFWDYEFGRWPADKGMRLDPLLLSPTISKSLVNGGVERSVRGEENASDHAPASIVLNT